MKITLTNDFHNTTVNCIVPGEADDIEHELTTSQLARIGRTLCGIDSCRCGVVRCNDWTLLDAAPYGALMVINRQREREAAFGPQE